MKLRSVMVPITNIGSRLSLPVILFGYFLSIGPLVTLGIVLFSLSVLFQPVSYTHLPSGAFDGCGGNPRGEDRLRGGPEVR